MVKIVTGLFSAFSLLQLIKMNWASPENNINVVKANGELTGNPCQRPNFVGRKIPTPDLWLKSAQLLAFCYEQVRTSIINNLLIIDINMQLEGISCNKPSRPSVPFQSFKTIQRSCFECFLRFPFFLDSYFNDI